ncbi:hypothetical protein OSB04_004069 [Centaurea solstitialis]|uniref:Protein ATEB1 homolog 2 n=1 Tax=Centaurea solstitialis TaxID=347529 RepID=A0AA38UDD0_9ASTR|nr:hypothetical protein OSB04_004069 [Centaurea solstitialis]
MASNIGMMDSAYFVGRNELLSWINARLQLNLSRIEEAASGAVQCQMMDMTYPGAVPMHKVNFDARTEYDMIQNYKVLQDVFNKLKIEKASTFGGAFYLNVMEISGKAGKHDNVWNLHIEVSRLVKGRPLDNLEFLQWLKRYCDSVNGGIMNENYNPLERRSKAGKERNFKAASQKNSKSLQTNNSQNPGSGEGMNIQKITGTKQKPSAVAVESGPSEEIQALSNEITELKISVDLLEKERDYYFAKLRDIEILCQAPELEHIPMVVAVKKVLYAADEGSALAEAQEIASANR